jgi:hypothetical protein
LNNKTNFMSTFVLDVLNVKIIYHLLDVCAYPEKFDKLSKAMESMEAVEKF